MVWYDVLPAGWNAKVTGADPVGATEVNCAVTDRWPPTATTVGALTCRVAGARVTSSENGAATEMDPAVTGFADADGVVTDVERTNEPAEVVVQDPAARLDEPLPGQERQLLLRLRRTPVDRGGELSGVHRVVEQHQRAAALRSPEARGAELDAQAQRPGPAVAHGRGWYPLDADLLAVVDVCPLAGQLASAPPADVTMTDASAYCVGSALVSQVNVPCPSPRIKPVPSTVSLLRTVTVNGCAD